MGVRSPPRSLIRFLGLCRRLVSPPGSRGRWSSAPKFSSASPPPAQLFSLAERVCLPVCLPGSMGSSLTLKGGSPTPLCPGTQVSWLWTHLAALLLCPGVPALGDRLQVREGFPCILAALGHPCGIFSPPLCFVTQIHQMHPTDIVSPPHTSYKYPEVLAADLSGKRQCRGAFALEVKC